MNEPPQWMYKIVDRHQWQAAIEQGRFDGAEIDLADGYIHFSTADQIAATAAKHFAGRHDLLLVEVATQDWGSALRWEPARGSWFPHLYVALPLDRVHRVWEMPVGESGIHSIPALDE